MNMKTPAHAGMVLLAFAASVAALAAEPDLLTPSNQPAFQLKDARIEKAVRETIAESREKEKDRLGAEPAVKGALRGDKYEEFGRQFSEANIPGCFGPDAMKHQPTGFTAGGWNFGIGGLLALPLWAAAAVRGKCK
jgi:hypothetical protein